eukprot:10599256-Alexandrium_andersonii.AAC.1
MGTRLILRRGGCGPQACCSCVCHAAGGLNASRGPPAQRSAFQAAIDPEVQAVVDPEHRQLGPASFNAVLALQ